MKIALTAVAGLLLAGISWSPAPAQGIPQGSYLRSCTDARVQASCISASTVPARRISAIWAGVLRRTTVWPATTTARGRL